MRRGRRRLRMIASLLAIIGVVSAACSAAPRSAVETTPSASKVSPSAVETTPAARFLVSRFDVANPQGFAEGFGSVWVPGHRDGTISRIDATTNQTVAVIEGVGYQAQDVAVADGSVWVPASGADYIARVDPSTNRVASKLRVGAVSDVDFGFGSLWAATKDMQLLRIDLTSGRVVAKLQIGPKGLNDCNNTPAVTGLWVWVDVCDTGMLLQIDPGTNRITRRIDFAAGYLVASREALWANSDTEIARLDPDSGKVLVRSALDPERVLGSMAVDDGKIWLGGDGILTVFDGKSLEILATFRVTEGGEVDPGVAFGSVWVESFDQSEVTRFNIPAT